MAYSLDVSQQNILDRLRSELAQPVHEVSIPEPETVMRNSKGEIDPYIAIQFGDLQDGFSETFGGAQTGDFWLPIYLQAVASKAEISRKISNRIVRTLLGFPERYGGQVRKRMGGSMFPIGNMDGTVSAYISPSSFGVKIQLFDDV